MDELISVMEDIRDILSSIDAKLDTLTYQVGSVDSKISDIKGYGLYNSIADICDKLDNLG